MNKQKFSLVFFVCVWNFPRAQQQRSGFRMDEKRWRWNLNIAKQFMRSLSFILVWKTLLIRTEAGDDYSHLILCNHSFSLSQNSSWRATLSTLETSCGRLYLLTEIFLTRSLSSSSSSHFRLIFRILQREKTTAIHSRCCFVIHSFSASLPSTNRPLHPHTTNFPNNSLLWFSFLQSCEIRSLANSSIV